jgi:hypothetical protein
MDVEELRAVVLRRGIRTSAVRLGNDAIDAAEYYCISKEGEGWAVYYYERGNRNGLRLFHSESDACSHLLSVLEKDRTVWSKSSRI